MEEKIKRESLELAMLNHIKAVGIVTPEREYLFHPDRKWRFDFSWPHLKIAVEVEGGTRQNGRHNRHEGFTADVIKYNWAARLGWKVYRFTSEQVKNGEAIWFLKEAIDEARASVSVQ